MLETSIDPWNKFLLSHQITVNLNASPSPRSDRTLIVENSGKQHYTSDLLQRRTDTSTWCWGPVPPREGSQDQSNPGSVCLLHEHTNEFFNYDFTLITDEWFRTIRRARSRVNASIWRIVIDDWDYFSRVVNLSTLVRSITLL